ncbi:MAG: hypothetical protein WCF33_17255 [Pseudonocardiaceae bacterium]
MRLGAFLGAPTIAVQQGDHTHFAEKETPIILSYQPKPFTTSVPNDQPAARQRLQQMASSEHRSDRPNETAVGLQILDDKYRRPAKILHHVREVTERCAHEGSGAWRPPGSVDQPLTPQLQVRRAHRRRMNLEIAFRRMKRERICGPVVAAVSDAFHHPDDW